MTETSLLEVPARQDLANAAAYERQFVRMRKEKRGLHWGKFPFGGNGWIAVDYDTAKEVLADNRFSIEIALELEDYPRLRAWEVGGPPLPSGFHQMDPPKQTKKRGVLTKHLTVKRVREIRPTIEAIVNKCLDDVEAKGSPADFLEGFTGKVPIWVLCDLLGVPMEERDEFLGPALFVVNGQAETKEQAAEALYKLRDYFNRLVERRKVEPGDDLISAIVRDTETAGLWTHDEMVGGGIVLLLAGHDAPSGMLGGILEWLANEPELYQRLRDNLDLLPQAVEEFLRYIPSTFSGTRSRIALEDVQVGDTLVKKGEAVLPVLHAANLDESVFEDAADLDVDVTRESHHVAFGHGAHGCPGSQLARMELNVALSGVLDRYKTIAPETPDPDWREKRLIRGPKELRLRFERA